MKKIIFLVSTALLFSGLGHNTAMAKGTAKSIELHIREFECREENVAIRFNVINNRNFDRPNVSLCFQIINQGKPVACRELRVVIPKGADGSKIYETIIEVPCGKEDYGLKCTVFYSAKRYQIEEWFAGCPGAWESNGHDELK